jgi:hypothetical protein
MHPEDEGPAILTNELGMVLVGYFQNFRSLVGLVDCQKWARRITP